MILDKRTRAENSDKKEEILEKTENLAFLFVENCI
jgi:hypothetical protein